VDVRPADGDLLFTLAGQQPLRLHPRGDGRWTSRSLAIDVWFDNSTLVIEQDGVQVRYDHHDQLI
jgi:hypothetical protein